MDSFAYVRENWRVSGYNKLRYSVIRAYCSTGSACIAHFSSTTNASVAYVVTRFGPSNAWYCSAWCATVGSSGWELLESKVPSMHLDDYALSVPGRHTIVAQNVCYVDVRALGHVFCVISGIRTTTVSNAWPDVDQRGLSEIE